ncbi:MAG: type II secretion system protein [Clostridiales bacterium]|nr:type II secretion system protein [Clostridiales bacterium]MDY5726388.1 type II secretion system protein [Eubacteriales bacterium]
MKKNNKKGFTIVELVIVIAVIAILAAVLIPTFSSVIKKAKVNNDIQLVRNLNTALATDNKKHETMQDALDAAAEFGYDVAKINNTSVEENEILWDSVNDVFCYLKDGALEYVPNSATTVLAVNDYRLWKISDTVDETYSTYYYKGSATTINTSKGFDAGTTTGITEIKYVNNAEGATAQNVVIRTNGGTLTVDADSDVVTHYNNVDKVIIQNIASESYHEAGNVAVSLEVNAGHVVVEPTATVKELNVPATATTATVSVQASSTVNTLVVDNNTATVDVNAGASITNVVAADSANVTIPESVGAAKVQKTEVGTKTELFNAIADHTVKYILLTDNIDAETRVTVDRDLIIDGSSNKYAISASNENSISNGRTLNVWGDNSTVTLKNLKIVGPTSAAYTRGVNIGDNNVTVTIDNCDITCWAYAINIYQPSDNLKLTVTDSNISGWAAINMWGFKHDISFTNSILTGTNDKNVGSSNNFATICFEADTTQLSDTYSGYNTITLTGCTVNAIETNSNHQRIVNFNSGTVGATGSTFITNNCTFNSTNKHAYYDGGEGNSWINDGEEMIATVSVDVSNVNIEADGYTATGTVKFTINGKQVSFDLSSAQTSQWTHSQYGTTGMDYVFEYNGGMLTYSLDLDIWSGYGSGYCLYVGVTFSE